MRANGGHRQSRLLEEKVAAAALAGSFLAAIQGLDPAGVVAAVLTTSLPVCEVQTHHTTRLGHPLPVAAATARCRR